MAPCYPSKAYFHLILPVYRSSSLDFARDPLSDMMPGTGLKAMNLLR